MTDRRRRWGRLLRVLMVLAGTALLILLALALILWNRLQASLPDLEGEVALPGLEAPARVERDHLGIPTIHASSRADLAGAIGFLHAQDRFFQMDLLRRNAAGELAELIGPALLDRDRTVRVHRLRDVARRVLARTSPEETTMLQAYAEGVNAGLASLGAAPFEYYALRAAPQDWRGEDTILVLLSMYLDLNDWRGETESALGVLYDVLPLPLADFLAPPGTEWDAPIVGPEHAVPPVPAAGIFDLRSGPPAAGRQPPLEPEERAPAGSNNWALAGRRTSGRRALVANDMHLRLSVPNIWYRAAFDWDDGGARRRASGITLPGTPFLVAGSNGKVAWGFTNAYGNFSDLVILEIDPSDPERYRTPDGYLPFDRHLERIVVKGGRTETLEVRGTIWGPVVDRDHRGRPRALRWIGHDPEAVNIGHHRLELAGSLEDLFDAAHRAGSPPVNLVAGDSEGRIGWTLLGPVPRRIGFDGRLPASWAGGARRWDGWRAPEEYPVILDPEGGQVWTANARVVGDEMLEQLGGGDYVLGARARQIRDALASLSGATERDLLAVQLDDRALFLARWKDLLLDTLSSAAVAASPGRAELRRVVETWDGHASIGSASFRMVNAWRLFLSQQVLDSLTARVREADDRFSASSLPQTEGPVWRLVTERPVHLLDPRFDTWEEALLAAADRVIDRFGGPDGAALAARTWGERNTTQIRHPLSLAVPFLSPYLDMPSEPLPGASYMPRVQSPSYGASQRMVVAPGHEEEGIFHMPGGQSGHPLSPHYRDGHAAWARGEPTPFLPGPPLHTLTLIPASPGLP